MKKKMTTSDFNEKYSKYLEGNHYGLAISIPKVIEYLDGEFQMEINRNPDFKYQQIKTKFNYICVYTNNHLISSVWEKEIKKIIHEQ